MSHQTKIHPVQIHILKVLLFTPYAGYAHIQKQSGLDSDHFNFHLKKLIELGYIIKNDQSKYTLTAVGKEHANKIDTDNNTIERQPKVSVIIGIVQQHEGQPDKVLVQQRLKQPFFGYWCTPGGKLRWGETIIQAGQRELLEETGLTCDLKVINIYHKIDVNQEDQSLLEDKIFFGLLGINPQGQLIEDIEGGKNAFMTVEEIQQLDRAFEGIENPILEWQHQTDISFKEKHHYYTADQY